MFSTSSKIAFGYILVTVLLLGSGGYVYKQMTLLTEPTGLEENIYSRRRTTHNIISKLYETEVIGQSLRVDNNYDFRKYSRAMREVHRHIDTLRTLLIDTIQQERLDTVQRLLNSKSKNMLAVVEAMKTTPTDIIYRQQLDSLLHQHDSIINKTRVKRRIVTHHNSYTIKHEPKSFFKRIADVFSPGKADSTEVNNVIQEIYTDTIDDTFSPIDTLATMLSGIQDKVFQTRQDELRILTYRINNLKIAGSKLSHRVNQLLESIEKDEQDASTKKLMQEQEIRLRAAWTMAIISIIAIIMVLVFFMIIWRDLTHSNHYRKELEKSKNYAENLLVAREKLMLTITHDIKAPAGSIIGYIDLLVRLVTDKRQQFYLSNMKSSAQHLLALVTSLLDYHRLEAGKMDLNPVSFKPHQLLEDIYNSFLPLATQKGLSLHLDTDFKKNLTLEGDPFRIRQILENLLSNALKFTSEGDITIKSSYSGNQFSFSVTDTGIGMTPEEQKKIFKEFTRLRSAQGQEGFGLGLSITLKLIELLNGKINIESTPGNGSKFDVSMPLPSFIKAIEEEKEDTTDTTMSSAITNNESIKVLIIDDDKIQLQLTEAMLKNVLTSGNSETNSYIKCCEHPEVIFSSLTEEHFDIVFTDIQMPAMNGFELLNEIRKLTSETAQNVPIVAITARGDMTEEDFKSRGFSGMLQKPFNQNDISRILSENIKEKINDNIKKDETKDNDNKTVNEKTNKTFNFAPLTAFSMDDEDAAKEIINTFICETEKNIEKLSATIDSKDMKTLCNTAHKMLPTFSMIEATEILPLLQWLENKRNTEEYLDEAEEYTQKIISTAKEVIKDAKRTINKDTDFNVI